MWLQNHIRKPTKQLAQQIARQTIKSVEKILIQNLFLMDYLQIHWKLIMTFNINFKLYAIFTRKVSLFHCVAQISNAPSCR